MKIIRTHVAGAMLIILSGCASTINKDIELEKRAQDLAHKFIITDGHIDIPWRLNKEMVNISERTEAGDFDYVRAKEGGLDAPFMSIYVPASYQETGRAKAKADSLIDLVVSLTKDYPDKFALAFSPDDVEKQFLKGIISLPMGMENGAPIEDDLSNLTHFYKRGIRYITLTHGKDNQICDSSYDTTGTWGGLSDFGRQVVSEMNRLGIMVDISHVSDKAFYQVMEITKAPAIASHSSCRHFTPGFERNMSDAMIKRLAENGGVIQITFGSTFISEKSATLRKENMDKVMAYAKENDLEREDEKLKEYFNRVNRENPFFAHVTDVADHIDHVVKIVGIDHVAFGSDYDGVGDSLPIGLKDASTYPNLIYHLLKRGYTEADIKKICYTNIFRVWRSVEKISKELQET